MISKILCFTSIFLVLAILCNNKTSAQSMQKDEIACYKTLNDLVKFVDQKPYHISQRDTILSKFIYFDYISKDTLKERVNNRIAVFDGLFNNLHYFIDSVGSKNLDALPVRFFKNDTSFYKPFTEELKDAEPNAFAYFNKRSPHKPLGVILFEPKTHKLLSWIVIDQGGYKYFLTFNLL